MMKFEMKLFKILLQTQMQAVKSSKMILQMIIYQIRKFKTFMRELNLALVARIN